MIEKTMLELIVLAIGILTIPAYANAETLSPLQQMKMGIPIDEIQCSADKVLMESPAGKPVCVYETTEKLENRGWEIIKNEISLIEYEFPLSASSLYDDQNYSGKPTLYLGDVDFTISNLPKIGETAEIEITFTNRVDHDIPYVDPDSPYVDYTSMPISDIPLFLLRTIYISDNFEFVEQADIVTVDGDDKGRGSYVIYKLMDTVSPNQTITMSATIKAVSEGFANIGGFVLETGAGIVVHVGNDQTVLSEDYLAMHPLPSLPLATGQSSEPKIYEKLRAMVDGTADYSGGTSDATSYEDIPEDELRAHLEELGLTPEEIEDEIRKAHPKASAQSSEPKIYEKLQYMVDGKWKMINEILNPQNTYKDSTYDFLITYPKSWIVNEYSDYRGGGETLFVIREDNSGQLSPVLSVSVMKMDLNGYDIIKNEKLGCAESVLMTDSGCSTNGSISQDVIINDKPVTIHQLLSTSYSFGDSSNSYHKVIIDLKTENTTWRINGGYSSDVNGEYSYDVIEEKAIVSDRIIKNIVNSFKINGYEYDWYLETSPKPNLTLDVYEYGYKKTDDLKILLKNNLNKSLYSIAGTLNVGTNHDKKGAQCFSPKIIDELKPNQTKQIVWDLDADCQYLWVDQILTLNVDYIVDKKSSNPMQEFKTFYIESESTPEPDDETNLTVLQAQEQLENHIASWHIEHERSPEDVFEELIYIEFTIQHMKEFLEYKMNYSENIINELINTLPDDYSGTQNINIGQYN